MTTDDLESIVARERQRQAALAREAARNGGAYDSLLGRWVEWNEEGPVAMERPT